ncbi:MAG: energy-coupled thiamine transporter ThiT [Dictyoglomus thermophilum]|uniref:energy-coupled thiamine transporter ThiT n=1 Tax=Dictyoglomus thermophilum TaxID=14 RepID=UPI0011EB4018|nr:energy-coupled thiamine transporter ThiT [Dictyoglomus thermophilum]MCX7719752.1 energy-coupled thiamine transporter ThiT [Dictyoglomus thermophilum]TYT21184.1 thiamine transporter [Dictyoglomus thermophilum]
MQKRSIRMLTEGALSIALSLLLWYLRIGAMPQGGSISLQMLPLFVFALRWGAIPGILVGLTYGVIHSLQDMYVVHWLQYLLDYPIAFGLIGLSGVVKNIKISKIITYIIAIVFLLGTIGFVINISSELPQAQKTLEDLKVKLQTTTGEDKTKIEEDIKDLEFKLKWYPVSRIVLIIAGILGTVLLIYGGYIRKTQEPIELGVFIGGLGRLFAHFLSGVIFFSQYAPPGTPAWIYSLIYNLFVVVPSTFVCLPFVLIIVQRLKENE